MHFSVPDFLPRRATVLVQSETVSIMDYVVWVPI